MKDYEELSILSGQIKGILSRADSMAKSGRDLSEERVTSGLENGVHRDFARIIEKAREINDRHGLGQHGMFVSLADSEIHNWSDLMDRCIVLLPVVEEFERILRPAVLQVKVDDSSRG